jgi:hypothetical protein
MIKLADATMTRRELLQKAGGGMGAIALAAMLGQTMMSGTDALAAITGGASALANPLAPKKAPLPCKAKHVIHIFAGGGPSHVDTWDPKPLLSKYADQALPGLNGLSFPSPFEFKKSGQSGVEVSEIFPELAKCIDDIAVVRSLWTDVPAHDVASRFMNTGSLQIPKPSMGSWVVYGLGTENQNMPGFISLGGNAETRQASFLPSLYQGVGVNYSKGMPLDQILLNIRNPFISMEDQKLQLALARKLNTIHAEKLHRDEQLEARIESFEMAFKMQTEATDAFDVSKEPKEIQDMYGDAGAGPRLLVARRLVERGVRFVQVQTGGWDQHAGLEVAARRTGADIDKPAAALLTDLKKRGLLDSTLVIWGGEFGRTVTRDNGGAASPGRDHNGRAMCCWMAGGGVKGGHVHGATDEFGARAAEDKVHIHDLHATILALLGFDHTKLTYRYNGRDFRLTDNFGIVAKDLIA